MNSQKFRQEPLTDPFTSLIHAGPFSLAQYSFHPEERQPRFLQNTSIIYRMT
jgi:hypothetical protein